MLSFRKAGGDPGDTMRSRIAGSFHPSIRDTFLRSADDQNVSDTLTTFVVEHDKPLERIDDALIKHSWLDFHSYLIAIFPASTIMKSARAFSDADCVNDKFLRAGGHITFSELKAGCEVDTVSLIAKNESMKRHICSPPRDLGSPSNHFYPKRHPLSRVDGLMINGYQCRSSLFDLQCSLISVIATPSQRIRNLCSKTLSCMARLVAIRTIHEKKCQLNLGRSTCVAFNDFHGAFINAREVKASSSQDETSTHHCTPIAEDSCVRLLTSSNP